MSRVSRGFHRLGIVVAVPIVGLALVMAALAWKGSRPLPLCTGMFDDLVPAEGARPTCLRPAPGSTDRGPWDLYRGTYSQTEVYGGTPDYLPAGAVLLTALGLYIAFRAVGWVIEGFS